MECVFVEKVGYKWLSRESTIKTGKQTYTYGWTQWLIVPQSSTQVNIWILYGTKVLYGLEAKKIAGNIFINSFDNMIHENQNLFVKSILNQMKTMKCYFDNELWELLNQIMKTVIWLYCHWGYLISFLFQHFK